jgi:hypothetical protein
MKRHSPGLYSWLYTFEIDIGIVDNESVLWEVFVGFAFHRGIWSGDFLAVHKVPLERYMKQFDTLSLRQVTFKSNPDCKILSVYSTHSRLTWRGQCTRRSVGKTVVHFAKSLWLLCISTTLLCNMGTKVEWVPSENSRLNMCAIFTFV